MAGCRWNKMISFVLILVYKYWHILVWTYVFKCDQMKWYKMTHLAGAPEAKGCELKVIAMLEYTWEQEYKSAWACEYSTAVSETKSTWETMFSFAWATLYVQLYSYTHLYDCGPWIYMRCNETQNSSAMFPASFPFFSSWRENIDHWKDLRIKTCREKKA